MSGNSSIIAATHNAAKRYNIGVRTLRIFWPKPPRISFPVVARELEFCVGRTGRSAVSVGIVARVDTPGTWTDVRHFRHRPRLPAYSSFTSKDGLHDGHS